MSKFDESWVWDEIVPPGVVLILVAMAVMFTMLIVRNVIHSDEVSDCKQHGVVVLVDDKAVCKYEKTVEL